MFRLGIASLYLVIPLDIVVGWALYRVFSPVSKSLSMLAATLRVAFAVVFMVAISRLVDVLRLLDNDSHLAAFSPEQLHTQALLAINAFNDVWHAGLFLFGLHLLVVGYLAFKSGYVPKLIAVLVAIDGLSYVVDTFGTVLSPGHLDRHRHLHLHRRAPAGTVARDPRPASHPQRIRTERPPHSRADHHRAMTATDPATRSPRPAKRRATSGDLLTARPDDARKPSVAPNTLLPGSTPHEHSLTGRSGNLSGFS